VQQDGETVKEGLGALVEKNRRSENARRCRQRDTDIRDTEHNTSMVISPTYFPP
jgi:hypothetical protein